MDGVTIFVVCVLSLCFPYFDVAPSLTPHLGNRGIILYFIFFNILLNTLSIETFD